jgi:hypothetical protein
MALEPVKLDDLTWPALMTAVRGRIPAASKGAWTLHAPVDPGVTLLELYAYLYEQRLFWMDQATPELSRAVLSLFGFHPRPAQAAATVMQFTSANVATIDAGTALWLERNPLLVFTTRQPVTVVPLGETRLFGGARNLTPELLHGREAELFLNGETDVRIELDVVKKPAPGDWLGILFLLETHPSIAPQWQPSSAAIKPGATLSFFYRAVAAWKPLPGLEDGTGGLRRSGIVRFRVPNDWTPAGSTYSLAIRKEDGTFTFPPRVAQLAPNAAIASHRRAVPTVPYEWTANNARPLPGLQLSLDDLIDPNDSFAPGFPIEDTVTLKIRERDGQQHEWKRVLDFTFSGPRDRVFVVDRARRAILFGDGLTGRLPRPRFGAGANVEVHYEAGGGVAGNVGARLQWDGEKNAGPCDIVNLADAGESGAESETIAAAQSRVGAALRTPNRAVLEADYVSIAKATPGTAVVRAHAASGFHPCSPCAVMPGIVTVFIVPYAPRPIDADDEEEFHYVAAPKPDDGTLEAVRKRLDAARLAGTEVYVAPPRYRAVRLAIELDTPQVRLQEVHARIFRALRAFLDPLGDWPFGEPLRPAVLRREAQQAAGTAAEIGLVSIGIDGNEPSENCREVEVGPHDLVYLTEVQLRVKPAPMLTGGLR